MNITIENIWIETEKGNLEVLNSSLADKVSDAFGRYPLHYLAFQGKMEVLNHPSVDKIRDFCEQTPLHELATFKLVSRKWLEKKYPWVNLKNKKIDANLIEEIISATNAEKFISSCHKKI